MRRSSKHEGVSPHAPSFIARIPGMHERTTSHPILYLAGEKVPEEPSLFVDFLETFDPNTRELWIHGTVAAPARDASEQHLLAHFVLDSAEPVINRLMALPLQKILGDRWGGKGGATLTIEARVTQRGEADPGLTYPAQASAAFAVLQVAFDEVGKLKIDHAVMTDEASSDFTSHGTLDLAQLEIRDDHAVIVVTAPRYMPELEWPAVYIEKGPVAFTIIDRPRGTPLSVLFPLREWDGNGLLRFTLRGLYADQYGARTFESKQVALTLHDTGLKWSRPARRDCPERVGRHVMTKSDVSAGEYSEPMKHTRANATKHCMALLGSKQHAFFTTNIVVNDRPDHWIVRPSTDRTNPPSGYIPGVQSEELYFRFRHDWGPGEYSLDWGTETGAFVLFGYNYRKDGVQRQSEASVGTLKIITASNGVLAGTFEAISRVPLDDGSKVSLMIQDGSFHFVLGSAR